MSKRHAAPSRQPASNRAVQEVVKEVTFRAGCGRTWAVSLGEAVPGASDLAYTEQAFAECPSCLHRVEPDGGPPFCTLRTSDAAHPFAALAQLRLEE